MRNCRPDSRCGHGQEGCETNADCKDGHECLENGFCNDIDECSESVGTGATYCGDNANCINEIGSFRCECQSGYENHVPNVGCSDINECLHNPAPGCAKRTSCTNTPGSFTCECRDGYTGDPHSQCIDVDECAEGGRYVCTFGEKTGLPDMACVNWPGTYQCVDASLLNGGGSYSWHMVNSHDRNDYLNSITKCTNHGLPNQDRYVSNSVYVNDYIFTCGGYVRDHGNVNSCNKLNLNTKQYEGMASMERGRRHHSLTYVEDMIYAIAGYSHANTYETGTLCEITVEQYDIEFDQWTMTTSMPRQNGVHRHCSVPVGHRIWVLGGNNCKSSNMNNVYRFNTRTKVWDQAENSLPAERFDISCNTLYLKDGTHIIMAAGGYNGGGRSSVFYLNLANEDGAWQSFGNLPSKTWGIGHLAYLGKSLVLWGAHAGNWNIWNFYVFNWDSKTFSRDDRHR